MTPEMYQKMLRVLGAVMAVVFWFVSMSFSYDGFNISVPNMAWVGIVLSIGVTVVELIWNKQGLNGNLTLALAGILCYFYGIYTNVLGIMAAQGLGVVNPFENPGALPFPVILGLFLEIVPEPLLVWGLVGLVDGGDFLGNLFGNVKGALQTPPAQHYTPPAQPKPAQQPQNQPKQQPMSAQPYHTLNGPNKPKPSGQPHGTWPGRPK